MALIDEIKEEIKKAHTPKADMQEAKSPEKKCRHKTKEEREAYIARKQAEEERRMLASQEAEKPRRGRKPKAKDETQEQKPRQDAKADANPEKRQRRERASYHKCPPKTIKTVDLPDGGSLVIIYMPGRCQ